MKKYYIAISAFLAFSSAFAQGPASVPAGANGGNKQVAGPKVTADVNPTQGTPAPAKVTNRGVNYTNHIRIGSSYYDLQTNYAMPHRILVHPDGAISAAWTTSPNDQTNFPQRGSGFNFRTTAGTWGKSDSVRVESNVRVGWPNLGLLGDGREFIIGHEANQGGFIISKAASRGERPTGATLILQETPFKPIWARMANNGDTIHMIYSYSDSSAAGDVRAPLRKGIRAPMVYSRSLDGGVNWDIQHIMLPGYDSTLTNNGGADQYAIDCIGNTVAIVNADPLQGVITWKSTDFGTNFTRIFADTFKYAPYSDKKLMADTPITNDGTVDIMLDNSGSMHVFWGFSRVLENDTNTDGYFFYPGVQGIIYWNEASNSSQFIAAGGAFDRSGDGANGLAEATSSALSQGALPNSSQGGKLNTCARLSNTSAMRQPNATMDANGNIYCIFSVPIEGDLSDLEANFRDIGCVFSKDSGKTWSTPQNLTQVLTREDDFACVARRTNNFLHLMWQQDEIPGTNLQNNSTADGNHSPVINAIKYQAIPLTDILDGTIGMLWEVGVEQPNTGELQVVAQNYPNPFSGVTTIMVNMNRPGAIDLNVRNTAGQLVKSVSLSGLMKGTHAIELDATGLPSGIYTYSLTTGGTTVTKTMMVK
ncbi:MAG: T9SS type A sorting domain-containing protein [Bacteroidia bacterium]|nr:T9SS type A sorting domain-containing protein [Bacteroidia bacterium]